MSRLRVLGSDREKVGKESTGFEVLKFVVKCQCLSSPKYNGLSPFPETGVRQNGSEHIEVARISKVHPAYLKQTKGTNFGRRRRLTGADSGSRVEILPGSLTTRSGQLMASAEAFAFSNQPMLRPRAVALRC